MSSGTMFIIAVLVVAFISVLAVFKSPKRIKEYFSTKEGKGVLWGILMFCAFGITIVLISKAAADELKYFQYGSVYLGLENSNKLSPHCEAEGSGSSRLASNGGLKFNILQSGDERFVLDSFYHHASCAFNEDREGVDAVGLMVEYRWFER